MSAGQPVRHRPDEMFEGIPADDVPVARVAELLRRRWRLIGASTLAGALLGLVLTFILTPKYQSFASFTVEAPPSSSAAGLAGLGALSGLAGQMGIAIPSGLGGATISPDYIAAVVRSRTIRDALLDTRFSPVGEPVSEGGTTLLALLPIKASSPAERREKALKRLSRMVTADVDRRTNIVNLTVTDADARRSAAIGARTLELVNWYNVSKRRSRSGLQREFAERRLTEAREELRGAEVALETFMARNRLYLSPALQLEHTRLRRRLQDREDMVTVLQRSYEEARLAEAGDLPVLSVLDAPAKPVRRSFPRPSIFIPLGALIGLLASLTLVLLRPGLGAWRALSPPGTASALRPSR